MNVPNNILMQSMMPGGKRLPKRPVLTSTRSWNNNWTPSHYQNRNLQTGTHLPTVRSVPDIVAAAARLQEARDKAKRIADIPPGNLHPADYRFWVGTQTLMSCFSKCRACGTVQYTTHMRLEHKEANGCCTLLVAALKLLNRDDKCVVCDAAAHHKRKWGVPLCSSRCVERWMFEPTPWEGLVLALQIARHDLAY